MDKKEYYGIDIVKFAMAIQVVAIHTLPLVNCNNETILNVYSEFRGLAVPFFFLSCGFLLSKRMSQQMDSPENVKLLRDQIRKYIYIYILVNYLLSPGVGKLCPVWDERVALHGSVYQRFLLRRGAL